MEQSNPLFGLPVHPSLLPPCLCVPSAYSTIDSHSDKCAIANVDIRPPPPLMRVYGTVVYPATLSFQSLSNPPGLLLLSSFLFYGKIGMFDWLTFPSKPFSGSGDMRGHVYWRKTVVCVSLCVYLCMFITSWNLVKEWIKIYVTEMYFLLTTFTPKSAYCSSHLDLGIQ